MNDSLVIAGTELGSRLIVGTGKYPSFAIMKEAIEAAGVGMVTVAVRRVNLDRTQESLLDYIDPKLYKLLPNTAGCYTAKEAVTTALLAREAGLGDFIKLEVIGDKLTLYPDNEELLVAAKELVAKGFIVMPYCNDDPVVARKLEALGCAAVMPLASPIGSGLGILNPYNIQMIRDAVKVPVVVDAGVGTASDAARAMELGVDGILMNTAIACAREPVRMARAMRLGVAAGRQAFLAGRIPMAASARASSPDAGRIE